MYNFIKYFTVAILFAISSLQKCEKTSTSAPPADSHNVIAKKLIQVGTFFSALKNCSPTQPRLYHPCGSARKQFFNLSMTRYSVFVICFKFTLLDYLSNKSHPPECSLKQKSQQKIIFF